MSRGSEGARGEGQKKVNLKEGERREGEGTLGRRFVWKGREGRREDESRRGRTQEVR